MKNTDEMLKALAAYKGPVKKCEAGSVSGAGDLHQWALRRAVGKSGVLDSEELRKERKRIKKLKKKTKLHQRFVSSGAAQHITFQQWLSQRSRSHNQGRTKVGKKHKSDAIVVPGKGDPCPRCGRPTQIREHGVITDKHRRQPFFLPPVVSLHESELPDQADHA